MYAFGQRRIGNDFTVVIAEVSLLAQAVQNSDNRDFNTQCVSQALQCGLVVARFAG